MSNIINKVKEALHSDHSTTSGTGATGTTGTAEGVAGPHSSRTANAADPRIDSDLDGRAAHNHGHNHDVTGGGNHMTGNTGTTGAGYGSTGTTGGAGYGNTNTTAPHSSGLANKVDPRVDSTAYGTGQTGTHTGSHALGGSGQTGTHTGNHGLGGTGQTGTHTGNHGLGGTGQTGTHTGNHGLGGTGQTGTHTGNHALGGTGDRGGLSNSTNAGPHNSNMANKVDPRVDSDLDGKGNRHGAANHHHGILGASGSHATAGSGTAQNTQGPHNSDTLNKLDPRVDADGDGSRTFPGNRTHATGSDHKDPTDAGQVTPSVLAQHIGQPTVLHGDKDAKHAERHGSISHQETHI